MNGRQDLETQLKNLNKKGFNIISWCGVGTTETKHSAMIADLLNPHGLHGYGEIPLKFFLEEVDGSKYNDSDLSDTEVQCEVSILDGDRRLDILLENKDFVIVIENKTESSDHYNQLNDYAEWLNQKNAPNKYLIYLTYHDNDSANQPPLVDKQVTYLHISYEKNIIGWLEKIEKTSERTSDVKTVIVHYRNFLNKLLECDYQEVRTKIILWAKENIDDAKEILNSNKESYSAETMQLIYEGLCRVYCENLLSNAGINDFSRLSVSDFSVDRRGSAPFCCRYVFENGNWMEFLPVARNGRSYGKLYAFTKDHTNLYGNLTNMQWNCNFDNWLNAPKDAKEDAKEECKTECNLRVCIDTCKA